MPVLDTTQFDFSQENTLGPDQTVTRRAVVRNDDAHAVLHVGVKSPVPWLEFFPSEFALAPQGAQTLTVELHPERAGHQALATTQVSLFGQYIALDAADADALPSDIEARIAIIPPVAACPHCGADLPDGARECRRCGERIRLCPVCGTPNTWLAHVCRLTPAHVLRTQTDWLASPGGDSTHAVALTQTLGVHLARRWSSPTFPPPRDAQPLEWSAPLAAFGLVVASAIDTQMGQATIQAFETSTGGTLWDFDLTDPKGLYPDRGAMALAPDGTLYAATLGGHVVALDAIRGTRLWAATVAGAVYGGVTVADDLLLVPAGNTLCALDRATGVLLQTMTLGGRLDTAPAYADGAAYTACDDGSISAFDPRTGGTHWRTMTGGPFDAAPLLRDGVVYAASITGTVFALDAGTGVQRWRTAVTPKGISVSPALSADGLLFVAADDGFVHILAADRGNLIRSRRISATPLRTAPVCSGHTVFIGADDGNIYALDADYAVQRVYETTPGARLASAGFALYGDTLVVTATNGVLYVLRATA
jgi:outer membrane protein assembly factor BamB